MCRLSRRLMARSCRVVDLVIEMVSHMCMYRTYKQCESVCVCCSFSLYVYIFCVYIHASPGFHQVGCKSMQVGHSMCVCVCVFAV
jgi:hypothetical protein